MPPGHAFDLWGKSNLLIPRPAADRHRHKLPLDSGMNATKPSWRKPLGIFLILTIIAVWSILVVSAADAIGGAPWPLEALFFLVAGTVWVLPLKPLLRWMETGRFRARIE